MASKFPPLRHQYDGLNDELSRDCGLTFDPAEDKARPEFGPEADVNFLLARYGVPVPGSMPFGELDYALDFQEAMSSILEARQAIGRLPRPFIDLYGGLDGAVAAFMNGHLETDYRDWKEHQASSAGSGSAATGEAGSKPPEEAR